MDATIALADDELVSSAATILAAPADDTGLALVRTPAELAAYASMATTTMEAPAADSTPAAADTSLAADAPAAAVTTTVAASGGSEAPTGTGPTCPADGSEYVGTVSYGADPTTAVVIDVVRLGDRIAGLEIVGCTEVVSALAG
jgi:hypothetical protein